MENDVHTLTPDTSFGVFNTSSGTFVLPTLPFETHALAPITSADTIDVHLGKHHLAYVNGANALLEPMTKRFESAVEVVRFARATDDTSLFEQSAQALNHGFFWTCHQAAGLTRPEGSLNIAINEAFNDFDGFVASALKLGKSRVGSGWIWLLTDMDGVVTLQVTTDADTFLDSQTHVALLVCDIWEHAFYLDHKSDKASWISGFFGQLADWKMAESRYESAAIMELSKA